jgi:hypothetical protein
MNGALCPIIDMIKINTDNYGLIDISQENVLELTTHAMAGDGTPVDAGWYSTAIDAEQLSKYKHFFIISDAQFSALIADDASSDLYMNLYEQATGPITSWPVYSVHEASFMSVAMPKMHYLYALPDDLSLIQLKLMVV